MTTSEENTMKELTADDFGMQWDAEHYFTFFESEDAQIMAWGHRDPVEFVDEVFAYDALCAGSDIAERHEPSDVRHVWAVRKDDSALVDGWWISWDAVTEETPGAFAVTVVIR